MQRKRPPQLLLVLSLICLFAFAFLPGCAAVEWATEPGGAAPIRDAITAAEEESAALDQVIADIETQLAALPEGEDRDELLELLDDAKAGKSKADAVAADLKTRLADADTGLDAIAAGLSSAGTVVPPPYGGYLAIAGGLLAALSETLRRRTKRAAQDIVVSIEHTKANNGGVVNFDDAGVKSELRSRMSTEARKLVEEAQARTGPLLVGTPLLVEAETG
ncbi:MAG: hypothetical protein AAGA29_05840 [Planctomycetota bacterium]